MANNFRTHYKDKMPKIWNKYSQKRNIGASAPISTFICLWANYIFPRWACLFRWRKYVECRLILGIYSINRSKTHECGNWGWGRAIPRKGIYKRNCRCSAWWGCVLRSSYRMGDGRDFAKNLRTSPFNKDQPDERPLLARSISISSTFKGSQAEGHLEVRSIYCIFIFRYPLLCALADCCQAEILP